MTDQLNEDLTAARFDEFSWNSLTPEQAADLSAEARQLDGLAHSSADGAFYIAARYDDVVAAEDDTATFSSAPTVFRPNQGTPSFQALEMDPPDHEVWRNAFRELVNPRTVKKLGPQILADVNRHLDSFIADGEADLVSQLAEHVPVQTICRVGGIDDPEVAEQIRLLARDALLAGGVDPQRFVAAIGAFGAYVVPLVAARRKAPTEDFLSHLGTVEIGGGLLDDQTLTGILFGLFAAGHHSTTSAMSALFTNVLARPGVLAALRADPAKIGAAIEESLRIDPPFYGFFRRATTDTELSGTKIGAQESVLINWQSANHDAAQFPEPEEFRLDRMRNKHVAFGYGIHTCVGAPLARLELKIALEQVLSRLPDLELVGKPRRYFGGAGATYFDEVRVRFTPPEPEV